MYNILLLYSGILQKIYDDIYDNNLYKSFGISNKNKQYLNEFLKSSFGISFCIISINYPGFFVYYVLLNIIGYFIKKSEFGPYEITGLLSALTIIPFFIYKNIENYKTYKTDFIYIFCLMIGVIIVDTICNLNKNSEYSYTKFNLRLCGIFILTISIIINNYYNIFTNSLVAFFMYLIGYSITSCIFQILLLKKYIKIPTKNTIKHTIKNTIKNKIKQPIDLNLD